MVHHAAVDGKNNARLLGGDVFEVEITGPENCAPKAEVTDNNNGWGCAIIACFACT
jgi:hypothetical protein